MSIRLEAVIEHRPHESLLFVPSLPGFVVAGSDAGELQRSVSGALKAHLAWLVRHDLIEEPAGEIDLSVVEQARSASAAVGPRFAADLPAPNEQELEGALAVGRASISDLIDAGDRPGWDEAPAVFAHIAERDLWYGSRLGTAGAARQVSDPVERLIDAAGAFEDAVDAFVASDRPDLWRVGEEEWTLAKVLRRRTAHLRKHAPTLPAPADDEP